MLLFVRVAWIQLILLSCLRFNPQIIDISLIIICIHDDFRAIGLFQFLFVSCVQHFQEFAYPSPQFLLIFDQIVDLRLFSSVITLCFESFVMILFILFYLLLLISDCLLHPTLFFITFGKLLLQFLDLALGILREICGQSSNLDILLIKLMVLLACARQWCLELLVLFLKLSDFWVHHLIMHWLFFLLLLLTYCVTT